LAFVIGWVAKKALGWAATKFEQSPIAEAAIAAIGKAQKASIGRLETAKLIDAIQKFEAGESRPPKDLNELVTMKYIAAIPPAPAGTKLEYTATDGSFKFVPIAPAAEKK